MFFSFTLMICKIQLNVSRWKRLVRHILSFSKRQGYSFKQWNSTNFVVVWSQCNMVHFSTSSSACIWHNCAMFNGNSFLSNLWIVIGIFSLKSTEKDEYSRLCLKNNILLKQIWKKKKVLAALQSKMRYDPGSCFSFERFSL